MVLVWQINDDSLNLSNFPTIHYISSLQHSFHQNEIMNLCKLENVNISVGIPVVNYMVDTTVAQPTTHCCSVCGELSNITQTIIGGLHFSKRSITFV